MVKFYPLFDWFRSAFYMRKIWGWIYSFRELWLVIFLSRFFMTRDLMIRSPTWNSFGFKFFDWLNFMFDLIDTDSSISCKSNAFIIWSEIADENKYSFIENESKQIGALLTFCFYPTNQILIVFLIIPIFSIVLYFSKVSPFRTHWTSRKFSRYHEPCLFEAENFTEVVSA